ncbi:MAG: threonylcarbamoyl-AMP synthase [Candidatus Bipolaricaulota bacterium]|nr:MAG: threonylcarbamoyl-AMP synthase [Candidatus Bipolaricaulota bacterium]
MTVIRIPFDDPRLPGLIDASLDRGDMVAFPTDTIYGLGGDPWTEAVSRVRALKERPQEQPFSLHLPSTGFIERFAQVSAIAGRWIERWLPGPYTVLLPATAEAPSCSVARGVVGLRVPDHPFFREILAAVGRPLFGTSANRRGEDPLLTADAIASAFPEVAVLIDDGGTRGSASAVVDLTGPAPIAVRGRLPKGSQ